MNKMKLIATAAGAVLLFGCASQETKPDLSACYYPDAPEVRAPGWICDEPVEGLQMQAVGSAPKSAAGQHIMKQRAEARARVGLAQQMQVHVSNMMKDYVETTGGGDTETVDQVLTSVTKQITDRSLVGAKTYKSKSSPTGTLYVLMGMNDASVEQATDAAVKTSMENDRAAWQQFRAKKGQEELDRELAAFREQMKNR